MQCWQFEKQSIKKRGKTASRAWIAAKKCGTVFTFYLFWQEAAFLWSIPQCKHSLSHWSRFLCFSNLFFLLLWRLRLHSVWRSQWDHCGALFFADLRRLVAGGVLCCGGGEEPAILTLWSHSTGGGRSASPRRWGSPRPTGQPSQPASRSVSRVVSFQIEQQSFCFPPDQVTTCAAAQTKADRKGFVGRLALFLLKCY